MNLHYLLFGVGIQLLGYVTIGVATNSYTIPVMLLLINVGRSACKKGFNDE